MYGYHFVKIVEIILGYVCAEINYSSFLKLQSISSGWEIIFYISTTSFLISTIILLLTRLNSGKCDERIHNVVAAICIMVASICLLITINGDKENVLYQKIGEQSYVEKQLQRFGKYLNKMAGPSPVDKFTNKYKRAGVYDQYTLAALAGLVNSLFYLLCSCSSKPKIHHPAVVMSDLAQNPAYV